MAKSPPAPDFLRIRTSEHTGIYSCGKKARNYVSAGRNCQKALGRFSQGVKLISGYDAIAAASSTPSHRF
jgi:hypothetical protein